MWIVCITSVRHVLTVNGYGGRQTKENEKSWCFKGWETLVNNKKVSFALVLKYLKEHTDFSCTYKAIRVWAAPDHFKSSNIYFPKSGIYLAQIGKVQICFFDKTLLKGPFTVTETHPYLEPSTI